MGTYDAYPKIDLRSPTGTSGESYVAGKLQDLCQTVYPTAPPEFATDMIVNLVVDEHVTPLFVGVQVKSGHKPFASPAFDSEGNRLGWWFVPKPSHHQFWINNALAYILVIYCKKNRMAYWVSAGRKDFVSTGKGVKVLVPEENSLDDPTCVDRFIEIAEAKYRSHPFENSMWKTGPHTISKVSQFRAALISPRLVAPHPSQSTASLDTEDPVGAIGLVMNGFHHMREMDRQFAQESSNGIPADPEQPTWDYRFLRALLNFLETGSSLAVEAVYPQAVEPHEKAAGCIAVVACLVSANEIENGLRIIESADTTGMSTIDQAWLRSHEAWLRFELGDNERAKSIATEWLVRLYRATPDVTSAATVSSLTELINDLSDWDAKDFIAFVQARDNTIAWWRAFQVEHVLHKELDFEFDLIRDALKQTESDSELHNRLLAASLNCLYGADYSGWRMYQSALAKSDYVHTVNSHEHVDSAGIALGALRLAGQSESVRTIAANLWMHGPTERFQQVAKEAVRTSTRSQFRADLALWESSADLLDPTDGEQVAELALDLLAHKKPFITFTNGSLDPEFRAVKILSLLIQGADDRSAAARLVNDMFRNLATSHELVIQRAASATGAWPDEFVGLISDEVASNWILDRPDSTLSAVLASRLIARAPLYQQAAVEAVRQGNHYALAALGSTDLPDDAFDLFRKFWSIRMEEEIEQQTKPGRGLTFGEAEASEILTLAYCARPPQAHWDPLVDLVKDPLVYAFMKRRVLEIAARRGEAVPELVRAQLADLLEGGMPARTYDDPFHAAENTLAGMPSIALSLLRRPDEVWIRREVERLAMGTAAERSDAVDLIISGKVVDANYYLRSLAKDPVSNVRSKATSELLIRQLRDGSEIEFLTALDALRKEEHGIRQSLSITQKVCRLDSEFPGSRKAEINSVLASSRSSLVRTALRVLGSRAAL